MLKRILLLTVVLLIVSAVIGLAEENIGHISGKLTGKNGESLGGGTVLFYNVVNGQAPFKNKFWRMPDSIAKIDSDGSFTAKLPEGNYYLGAIKRVSGNKIGPPAEGDLIFVHHNDKKEAVVYNIKKNEKTEVGTIAKALPYKKTSEFESRTAIEGVFYNALDKPVEGATVFAYKTPAMNGRPVFVSPKTGKDGKYLIRVPEGGVYYLKARNGDSGGPPIAGEILGFFGGDRRDPVTVKADEIVKGIEIKGKVIPAKK